MSSQTCGVLIKCPSCGRELDHVISVEYVEYCEKYRAVIRDGEVEYDGSVCLDRDFIDGEVDHYECPYCGEEIARNAQELLRLAKNDSR